MKFDPSQFMPTQWDTSQDKCDFADKLSRFIERGFPSTMWTKSLYHRLSNMFGHIAHYDKQGFWDTWFADTPLQAQFLENMLEHTAYGDPTWTWSDVEQALQRWLQATELAQKLQVKAMEERKEIEMILLRTLAAKYNMEVTPNGR